MTATEDARPKGRPRVDPDTARITTRMPADVHLAMKTRAVASGVALGQAYMEAVDVLREAKDNRPPFLYAVPDGSPNIQISCSPKSLGHAKEIADDAGGSLSSVFLTAATIYLGRS